MQNKKILGLLIIMAVLIIPQIQAANITKDDFNQVQREINKPVKWQKNITFDSGSNLTFDIPSVASKLIVKKRLNVSGNIIYLTTINYKSYDSSGSDVTTLFNLNYLYKIIIDLINKILSRDQTLSLNSDLLKLTINDSSLGYLIEYETPGPTSSENINIINKDTIRDITIKSDYEYDNFPVSINLSDKYIDVKVNEINGGSKRKVEVIKTDSNGNGMLDSVQWIIPHFSTSQFTINETNQSQFGNGTTARTNTTVSPGDVVLANSSTTAYYEQGNFTSQIFDAGQVNTTWSNISWIEEVPYGEELPNSGIDEIANGLPGGANMSGNTLLYHFNNISSYGENESNVTDFSGRNFNGFSRGASVSRTNITNKVFGAASKTFDGIDDNITTETAGSSFLSVSTGSIEAWIYPVANVTDTTSFALPAVVGQQISRLLGIHVGSISGSDNIWAYNWDGNEDRVGISYNKNQWTHVVWVHNSGTLYLYTNGILAGSVLSDNTAGTLNTLVIGKEPTSTYGFNGSMDELAIWNRSLSAAEIRNHYLRGVLNLTFQVRSCDDSACNGESFVGGDNTTNTFFKNATYGNMVNITTNRWFQYRAFFTSNDSNYTPILSEVIIMGQNTTAAGPALINPNVTAIVLGSASTNTTENLICNVTVTGLGSLSANISWFKNNISNISFNGSITNGTLTQFTLHHANTTKSDSWHCGATPRNDTVIGNQSNSTAIVITNLAPYVGAIALGSAGTNTTENLICNVTITDNDTSDSLSVNVSWFKNNISNISFNQTISNNVLTQFTLNNANTTKGDSWHCGATPKDDSNSAGPQKNSTQAIVITNLAPYVQSIVLGTPNNNGSQNLICNVTIIDNDTSDSLSANISWFKNNIGNISFNQTISNNVLTQFTLNATNLSNNDAWKCGGTPKDDSNSAGPQVNSSAVTITSVDNAKPSINITSPIADQINNQLVFINLSVTDNTGIGTIYYDYNGTNITYNASVYQTIPYGAKKLKIWANDTSGNIATTERDFNVGLKYKNGLPLILALIALTINFLFISSIFVPRYLDNKNTRIIYAFKSLFILLGISSSIAIINIGKKLMNYEFEEAIISNVITSLSTFTTWIMIFLLIYIIIFYILEMWNYSLNLWRRKDEKS